MLMKLIPFSIAAMFITVINSSTLAQDGGEDGPPPATVHVAPVALEMVQDGNMVTGDLRTRRHARVAAQEEGLILELAVEEGQHVTPEQPLAQLDDRRLKLSLGRMLADREVAAGQVDEHQAELTQAEEELEIVRELFNRDAANPKELLDVESAANVSRARLKQSQARVKSIDAEMELLQERLDDMTVYPPFAGVIVAVAAEEGEWLNQGDGLLELVATDEIEAWLDVPQRYLAVVTKNPGQVNVQIAGINQPIVGSDERVIPLVDERARTFTLIVQLETDQTLAPGMSVTAWVPTGEKAERLTVPKDAVLQNESGFYVYASRMTRPNAPPSAVPVSVEVLFARGSRFIIKSPGLQPDEQVVVEGNERLFPMAPLNPIEFEESPEDAAIDSSAKAKHSS